MYQHFDAKEEYDIEKRHNERGDSLGERVKGISYHKEPVKRAGISLGRARICIASDQSPYSHTYHHRQIAIAFFDVEPVVFVNERKQTVDSHYAVEKQSLNYAVGCGLQLIPHYSRRIDDIAKV